MDLLDLMNESQDVFLDQRTQQSYYNMSEFLDIPKQYYGPIRDKIFSQADKESQEFLKLNKDVEKGEDLILEIIQPEQPTKLFHRTNIAIKQIKPKIQDDQSLISQMSGTNKFHLKQKSNSDNFQQQIKDNQSHTTSQQFFSEYPVKISQSI